VNKSKHLYDLPATKFDEIDNDDQYYKVLLGDVRNQSTTSLYATTPENMNEMKPDDEFAGEAAIHNHHNKFKTFKKIKEKEMLDGLVPKYSLVEFLNSTEKRRILPKMMGLVNKAPVIGDSYPLERVHTIYVGKDYAEPFSEGLKIVNRVKQLDVTSSDLHYDMLLPIIEKVPLSLESLIIAHNCNLTFKVYKSIAGLLDNNQRV
jgi:hypothetical protein